MALVFPQAESFLLTGHEEVACLFIHGFTASPSEVYSVAQIIHETAGCTVSGPLLPGHGCSPREMNQTCWQDWSARVEQEVHYLQRRHKRVFVVGLSMGGLLALYAAGCDNQLQGVIAINTPIFTNSRRLLSLAPLLQYLRPYHAKKANQDTAELEAQGRFAYPVWPVKALVSMQQLRSQVVQGLPSLDLPILLFQSRMDETVDPRSGPYIKDQAVQARVKLIELHNSGHIATMSPDQQVIVEEILAFIS